MASGNPILHMMNRVSLVKQIVIGLVLGIALAWLSPQAGMAVGLLGNLFVGALKAVAPVLVFVLVMSAIAQHQKGNEAYVKPIIVLYIIGTFLAALSAVIASFMFPTNIILVPTGGIDVTRPRALWKC
jgi:serine/threonine transporter